MIDISTDVFAPIAQAINSEFPGAYVTAEYVKAPASFPHISIVESDNFTTIRHLDSADKERFSTLMYEVNVYSNRATGKKSECRSIMALIDEMMFGLNFTRLSMTPVPNLEDATIYRITARYRAETDGVKIYRI